MPVCYNVINKKKKCEKHGDTLPCIQCQFEGYSEIIKREKEKTFDK